MFKKKYFQPMLSLIRLSGVIFMLYGIADVYLRRFFDVHILNVTGSAYLAGLLGIFLVEIGALLSIKNSRRWNNDR